MRAGRTVAAGLLAALVAGCTQVDTDGLDPTDTGPRFPDIAQTPPPAITAGQKVEGLYVHFAPVVGAPADRIAPLGERLAASATARGIALAKGPREPGVTHVVNGYFSAFADGGKTTVGHVWDVSSADGRRLHRIQGQEVVAASAPDPWSVVTAETMARIADRVVADLAVFAASPSAPPQP